MQERRLDLDLTSQMPEQDTLELPLGARAAALNADLEEPSSKARSATGASWVTSGPPEEWWQSRAGSFAWGGG